MSAYRILRVEEKDFEECSMVIRRAFEKNAIEYGFTPENYPSSGAFITTKKLIENKNKGIRMYAAYIDDEVVAYVQLEKSENNVYNFQKFAVLPEHQQTGIGRALIDFCKNKAHALGADTLKLIMVDKNERLKYFYKSCGFVVIDKITDNTHPFLQAVMELKL